MSTDHPAVLPPLRAARVGTAAALSVMIGLPTEGRASIPLDDPFAELISMTESELAELRGGFEVPFGLTFDFAANVRTMIDGRMVLETVFTTDPQGRIVSTQATPAASPSAGAADPSVVVVNGGTLNEALKGTNVDASALSKMQGVVSVGGGGVVAGLNAVTAGQISNIVLSTAANRSVQQDLQAMITVNNFNAVRQASSVNGVLGRITSSLSSLSLGR